MTTLGSEIAFSVIALVVVLWGYTQVRLLDKAVSSQSDHYTVFTMKRRLLVKAFIAVQTLLSALYVMHWLTQHGGAFSGPVENPVAFRTFSFNVIDLLICVQVVWDVRASHKGAELKLADATHLATQKRKSDPHPGEPL